MPAVRSLSMAGPTFTKMGDAAMRANVTSIRKGTDRLGAVVEANGRRFHIKGRSGAKVPLGAKPDTRGFNGSRGVVVTGAVRGVPQGFWHIVEYGSGRHIIVGRSKSGRKQSTSATLRRLDSGDAFNTTRPLRTPYGPRQFVDHPGHRTLGKPWAASMAIGRKVVPETVATEQTRALIRAFT